MGAIGSPQQKLSGKVSNPNVAQAEKFLETLCERAVVNKLVVCGVLTRL
jgi:hypothetical protein